MSRRPLAQRMGRCAARLVVGCVVLCACVSPIRAGDGESRAEVERLEKEVTRLRQELAATKLELRRLIAELTDLREFLATNNPDGEMADRRRQRAELEAERDALRAEREELESDTRKTRRAIIHREPPPAEEPLEEVEGVGKPEVDLHYTLSYIRNESSGRTTYIDFGNLLIPDNGAPNIDPDHVLIRGTIQNRSGERWRYTFEVRIADRRGNLLGRWRHQTPVLGAHELHTFELDVPVTDALRIDRYQIGRIEADRGDEAKP